MDIGLDARYGVYARHPAGHRRRDYARAAGKSGGLAVLLVAGSLFTAPFCGCEGAMEHHLRYWVTNMMLFGAALFAVATAVLCASFVTGSPKPAAAFRLLVRSVSETDDAAASTSPRHRLEPGGEP